MSRPVDRTPKPCLHKQANHQHGTHACYVLDRCRCEPCTRGNREYERNRTRQQAYGRWNGLVDAQPARDHIRRLMDQGMGLKRIAAVSGVSQGVLWKLIYGKKRPDSTREPSKRIRPATERRLLGTSVDLAGGARVDTTGAIRRVRALVALGWSQSKIAVRIGVDIHNFGHIIHARRGSITVAHDKAIRALYDEWSMKLPPAAGHRDKIAASRSRNYAKARGWLPPLAWDDSALDDPDAEPPTAIEASDALDEAAVLRRMSGDRGVRITKTEAAETIRRLRAAGISDNEITKRTGLYITRYVPAQRDLPASTKGTAA